MNKKSVILFIIAVLEMILYIFINETMYIGTLKSFDELYLYQLISILIFEIVYKPNNKKEKIRKVFLKINMFLLIILPVIFMITLPKYSYFEAKKIFINKKVNDSAKFIDVENITEKDKYKDIRNSNTILLKDSPYFLPKEFYLFFIEYKDPKSSKEYCVGYIFNSCTGKIKLLNVPH
ncbi:hypothetical protein ACFIJ5_18400 (plasmid) [Haloimpatiens sp. FM7330]|uniref:hypothetical protein n=1 Tax=Haloimpatiens sp. FM7330 TaxID=3298610 RepID=UPI003637E17F